jgi:acyl-coenzyme A thioesterase PaaI-like protein
MDMPKYKTCFVCGWENKRGLNLTFRSEGDYILTDFEPEPDLCGWEGIVHGGIVSAVLDECMGWTGCPDTGYSFLTAELNVRFLKPVKGNARYLVKSQIHTKKGRFFTATGELSDKDGNILAKASVNSSLYQTKPSQRNHNEH